MSKEDVIEVEGVVVEAMPNAMFLVEIQGGHRLLAHISGKLRMNFIRILPGDKVTVQMSPYDVTWGRLPGDPSNRLILTRRNGIAPPPSGRTHQ